MLFVYGMVAVIQLIVGLASAPRPRSIALIALAALLWPLTMAVIMAHVYLSKPSQAPWRDAGERNGTSGGQPRGGTDVDAHRSLSGAPVV